jgi:hypothetical protein
LEKKLARGPGSGDQGAAGRRDGREEAEMIACPKCGTRQEEGEECLRCGVVMRKYVERKHLAPLATRSNSPAVDWAGGSPRTWKRKALQWALLATVPLWAVSFWNRHALPVPEELNESLYAAPQQARVDLPPFETTVGDITYTITPLYRYELAGMVVSYHDSSAWWDIYHHGLWNDCINVKDLCVIWGDNVKTDVYRKAKFSSDVTWCYWQLPNYELLSRFRNECLSNNHLLSDRAELNRKLRRVRDGEGTTRETVRARRSGWRIFVFCGVRIRRGGSCSPSAVSRSQLAGFCGCSLTKNLPRNNAAA